MEQQELFDIPSPCINVCEANSKGFCKGCLRSRKERVEWKTYSNEKKRQVLRICAARKRAALAKTALPEKSDSGAAAGRQEDLFG